MLQTVVDVDWVILVHLTSILWIPKNILFGPIRIIPYKGLTLDFFGKGKHKITPEKLFEMENAILLDVRSKEEADSISIKMDYHLNIECHCCPINFFYSRKAMEKSWTVKKLGTLHQEKSMYSQSYSIVTHGVPACLLVLFNFMSLFLSACQSPHDYELYSMCTGR